MKLFIQYIFCSLLFFSLFTENISQFFEIDNSITIENIEFEKDSNEDEKNLIEWKHILSNNPLQQSIQYTKQNLLCYFYTDQYYSDYIHNITPPPRS